MWSWLHDWRFVFVITCFTFWLFHCRHSYLVVIISRFIDSLPSFYALKTPFVDLCFRYEHFTFVQNYLMIILKLVVDYLFKISSFVYEGWSKSSFLFLIQKKVQILSKFCDIHIEIKYISSNWILFEKQLWRHSLWHVKSRDIPKGVIVVLNVSLWQNLRHISAVKSIRYLLETHFWN